MLIQKYEKVKGDYNVLAVSCIQAKYLLSIYSVLGSSPDTESIAVNKTTLQNLR